MNIRGFRYHPVDLETTVIRSHRFVTESAVFTWTKLLVVVAEIKGSETDALDLVPVITTALLEEQQVGSLGWWGGGRMCGGVEVWGWVEGCVRMWGVQGMGWVGECRW